ncbi:DUF1471 domain-containing protein [Rahnella laticis]|uniref:DUF1471 domain-containing protein n=1 Tax=Rahnella laticis TaxID=2787622 RepID=UPI00398F6541
MIFRRRTILLLTLASCFINTIYAAEPVADTRNLKKMGTISVSRASTLDDLEIQISKRTDRLYLPYYRITSAGGENFLHGTADVYKQCNN